MDLADAIEAFLEEPEVFLREDIAYAAGLFEGEGWIGATRTYRNRRGELKPRPNPGQYMCVAMTDSEPLEKMREIFGGTIYGPYPPPSGREGNKPRFKWHLAGFERTQAAAAAMWEWLSPRRKEQVRHALQK